MNLRLACGGLALAAALLGGCCHSHCHRPAAPAVVGTAPCCPPAGAAAVAPPPPIAAGAPPPAGFAPVPPPTGTQGFYR